MWITGETSISCQNARDCIKLRQDLHPWGGDTPPSLGHSMVPWQFHTSPPPKQTADLPTTRSEFLLTALSNNLPTFRPLTHLYLGINFDLLMMMTSPSNFFAVLIPMNFAVRDLTLIPQQTCSRDPIQKCRNDFYWQGRLLLSPAFSFLLIGNWARFNVSTNTV